MMTEALANKSCTPCRGGVPPLTREHAEILLGQPRHGSYQRKLTTSSGVSGFAISGRRLASFRRLVNSRKLKAIIRISASVGAMRRYLQTKKIHGLHENDFIMATKIDRIFARKATA